MGIVAKIVIAGAAGHAVLAMAGTAWALSCAINPFDVPESGAVGVPTDTLLWRFNGGNDNRTLYARLIGPEGEVPLERRFLPVGVGDGATELALINVPLAPLQPSSRYRVEYELRDAVIDPLPPLTFTTGPGPAPGAPPLPQLLSAEPDANKAPTTTISRHVTLRFATEGLLVGEVDGALDAPASVRELLLGEAADPAGYGASDALQWATQSYAGVAGLAVGKGFCISWANAAAEREVVRFGTFDLAGNFSGWGASEELVLPTREEAEAIVAALPEPDAPGPSYTGSRPPAASGCALGHAGERSAIGGAALLSLGAVLMRRKARTQSRRVQTHDLIGGR